MASGPDGEADLPHEESGAREVQPGALAEDQEAEAIPEQSQGNDPGDAIFASYGKAPRNEGTAYPSKPMAT